MESKKVTITKTRYVRRDSQRNNNNTQAPAQKENQNNSNSISQKMFNTIQHKKISYSKNMNDFLTINNDQINTKTFNNNNKKKKVTIFELLEQKMQPLLSNTNITNNSRTNTGYNNGSNIKQKSDSKNNNKSGQKKISIKNDNIQNIK